MLHFASETQVMLHVWLCTWSVVPPWRHAPVLLQCLLSCALVCQLPAAFCHYSGKARRRTALVTFSAE